MTNTASYNGAPTTNVKQSKNDLHHHSDRPRCGPRPAAAAAGGTVSYATGFLYRNSLAGANVTSHVVSVSVAIADAIASLSDANVASSKVFRENLTPLDTPLDVRASDTRLTEGCICYREKWRAGCLQICEEEWVS